MDYNTMRAKIVEFINSSGISAYDLARISKTLCCCRTCKFFVQHYSKDSVPVDFGHCIQGNRIKSRQPNTHSCGFWIAEE